MSSPFVHKICKNAAWPDLKTLPYEVFKYERGLCAHLHMDVYCEQYAISIAYMYRPWFFAG